MKIIRTIGLAILMGLGALSTAQATVTYDDARKYATELRKTVPDLIVATMEGPVAKSFVEAVTKRVGATPITYEYDKVLILSSRETGVTIIVIFVKDVAVTMGKFPTMVIDKVLREANG